MRLDGWSTRRVAWTPCLWGVFCATIAGCGSGDIERIPVSGTVTFQGQPVAAGQVLFFPVEDTQTPMTGAMLLDGRYEANAKGGVPVGSHRVKILGYRYHPKIVRSGQAPETVDLGDMLPKQQYLPAKYNQDTQLKVTLEPGSRPLSKDFKLVD